MPEATETKTSERSRRPRVGRVVQARARTAFVRRRASEGVSQRHFAAELGIPRTTLQYWLNRAGPAGADAEIAAFFDTPAGVVLLHHIMVAAHLTVCWMGAGGIRLVCFFLIASGLAPFVAHSYGAQQGIAAEIQAGLTAYGREERARLQSQMPPGQITVCEDETFLSKGMSLVAVEPVSGFVLVEEYAARRDTETWKAALARATTGMPVEVVQVTSDEAKALRRHAEELDAHHSPDVFHVQHAVCGALGLPMQRRQKLAEEAVQLAEQEVEKHRQEHEAWRAAAHGPGRPPDFVGRIRNASVLLEEARVHADDAAKASDLWRGHMRTLAEAYHPFELESGVPQDAGVVAARLQVAFDGLRAVARDAGLSERALAGIEKAARVAPAMRTTLAWYEARVDEHVEALALPESQEIAFRNILLPSAYLQRVAQKSAEPARRRRVLDTVARLQAAMPALPDEVRDRLQSAADLCADLFQRSSSCVEGRNGRLSQFQHALRRLTPEKQTALTVVHNFLVTRPDGTTAAERFFGAPPASLIEYLRERVSVPARPARSRPTRENHRGVQASE